MVSAHQFDVFIRVEGKFPEVEHYNGRTPANDWYHLGGADWWVRLHLPPT